MRAGPAVCVLHSSDRAGAATAAYATGAYVAAYERAVFCLQPWGDTATRKGFYDAIAVGCIPVIFSRHGFESLEWMGVNLDELSILVPLANLTARGGALGYLSSLPRDKVVKLQASINSRRSLLQYGMRPGQPTRDAIDMLVSRVAKQLWRSAHGPLCGRQLAVVATLRLQVFWMEPPTVRDENRRPEQSLRPA